MIEMLEKVGKINSTLIKSLENYIDVLETKDFTKMFDEDFLLFQLNVFKHFNKIGVPNYEKLIKQFGTNQEDIKKQFCAWIQKHIELIKKKDFCDTDLELKNDIEIFKDIIKSKQMLNEALAKEHAKEIKKIH